MAKLWIIEYEVVGTGQFPIDMLRYDASYPAGSGHGIEHQNRSFFSDEEWRTPRRVRLHHRNSFSSWEPTFDRWASFGWHVDRNTIRHWSL